MTKQIALIPGVTGQDGSNLAEFLRKNGYFAHDYDTTVAIER